MHIVLAAALALACPAIALADEASDESGSTAVAEESASFKILAGDSEIEKLTDAYEAALAEVAAVEARIVELQQQIDEIEAELPAQQARSDAGLKQRYIMQSNPLIVVESLLSSESIGDLIKQADYLERISRENLREYNRLVDMKEQVERARAEQEQLREEATSRAEEAASALRAEQDRRTDVQAADQEKAIEQAAKMGGKNSVENSRDKKSSKKGASASASASESSSSSKSSKDAKSSKDSKSSKSSSKQVEATTDTEGIVDGIDWHIDRDAFLDEWAGRIDAYLAGSPLEGQGRSFAAAAWKYGVDPRWSPAISTIESSKGAYCIRPHNAWGWGASDADPYGLASEWASWEEAIDAHVRGLSKGYGYTISMGKARTYCPPNWQLWYNTVLGGMRSM